MQERPVAGTSRRRWFPAQPDGGSVQARVYVTLKRGVLDPQGKAVARSLLSLGYEEVEEVRLGKFIEVTVADGDPAAARERLEQMCRRLLANTVIEDYRIELVSPAP